MKKETKVRSGKRLPILKIALVIIGILLVAALLYKIYQVKDFQNNLREPTDAEKQQIVHILNEKLGITSTDIIFGNVLMDAHGTLVQVQVKEGNLRKIYLINLDNNNLVRKYDEK
jgi:hypothetical protein